MVNALPNAGSGGGEVAETNLQQVKSGTFTGKGSAYHTLTHNLGVVPKVIVVVKATTYKAYQILQLVNIKTGDNTVNGYYIACTSSTTAHTSGTISNAETEWTDTTAKIVADTTYKFISGQSFRYYIYA
jgi:hypothetical protein